jgi:D-alanyl-D-alanine dipeptidase
MKKLYLSSILAASCLYNIEAVLQKAELVEIQEINPAIEVDLIWASSNNELGLILYPDGAQCYLHKEAAFALDQVQSELTIYGYGLKILEGYRPLSAQRIIWDHVGFNPPYPEYGRHALGTAVDLTLINLFDGSAVPLPAYQSREINPEFIENLTQEQRDNLEILKGLMEKYGFIQHAAEWFHFDFHNYETFAALDDQFSELA